MFTSMKINMGINTWLTIHFTLGHLEPLNQNKMTADVYSNNLSFEEFEIERLKKKIERLKEIKSELEKELIKSE